MRKIIALGIMLLFISMSILPSNGTVINVDVIEKEALKEFINVESSLNGKESLFGNPPVVEILYPQNGSIVYTRHSNISVKFTDDTGLTSIDLEYGGEHYSVGTGAGINPPCKIFYFNRSMQKVRPGYVWIVAKAYDEDGNIGIDTATFYYNDSNDPDLYPPEINLWTPRKGSIYIFGKSLPRFFDINILNYSIVIGKFEIYAHIDDLEGHLQKVELYIDNEVVHEQEYSNKYWDSIHWDCNKLIIGMHEIKIVAIDSSNNSAMEKLNCFIINFF